MRFRIDLIILIIISILVIIVSMYRLSNCENFHDYGSVNINDIDRKEFNTKFSTDVVVLPKNICAIGIDKSAVYIMNNPFLDKNNAEYLYTKNDFIPYIMKYIIPKLRSSKLYFIFNYADGHGERLDLRSINYYNPQENEFEDKSEIQINKDGQFPLLHKRKYVLTNCKLKKDIYAKAIPDRHFISQVGYHEMINNMINIINKIPWDKRKNIAIWRGKIENGSKYNFIEYKTDMNQREYFVDLYKKGQLKNVDYSEEKLSKEQMCEYKYLIDIDGWSNTWDATVWKMLSGSVLLKVGSVWEQWYYDKLKEWVHYVPVKDDFSDLNEKIQWCLDNDDMCRIISRNAYNFVLAELTFDKASSYTIDIFNNYVI